MARLARVVVPGLPHHIRQRGNRRQRTFFRDEDYAAYMELMAEWCAERVRTSHPRVAQPIPRGRSATCFDLFGQSSG